jgi:hypothetical protein
MWKKAVVAYLEVDLLSRQENHRPKTEKVRNLESYAMSKFRSLISLYRSGGKLTVGIVEINLEDNEELEMQLGSGDKKFA